MASDLTITKCRTCMNQLFNFYQLYDYIEDNHRILEMLDVVVPQIHIKEESQFSHLICQLCVDKLLTGYKFQRLCIETDNHLRRQLGVAPLETYMKVDPLLEEGSGGCEMNTGNVEVATTNKVEGTEGGETDCSKKSCISKYTCNDCGKIFDRMSRLKAHCSTHTKKRRFACTICSISFATEKAYKAHKKKHKKNFRCRDYGKAVQVKEKETIDSQSIPPTEQTEAKQIETVYGNGEEEWLGKKDDSAALNNETANAIGTSTSPQKERKRSRKENTWKKNVLKTARNCGKSYVSHTPDKKVRCERKIKPTCPETCKLKCTTQLNDEDRKRIFSGFWGLGNLERQRQYIANNIEPIHPKYRYIRGDSLRKPRVMNNAYYFRLGDRKVRVCKLFFMNTLDINDRNIRTVVEKKHKVADTILEEDKRGKHGHHTRLDESIKDRIRQYITSISKIECHSSRPNTTKHFIDGNKTISDIHKEYLVDCEQNKVAGPNYTLFYRICKDEFNITFLRTKKKPAAVVVPPVAHDKVEVQEKAQQKDVQYDQNMIMNLFYNR